MDLGLESYVFFLEEVSSDFLFHSIIIKFFSFLMDDSGSHSAYFKVQSAGILSSETFLILAKLDLIPSAGSGGPFLTTDRSASLQTLIIVEKSSILSVATLHLRVGSKRVISLNLVAVLFRLDHLWLRSNPCWGIVVRVSPLIELELLILTRFSTLWSHATLGSTSKSNHLLVLLRVSDNACSTWKLEVVVHLSDYESHKWLT